MEQVSYFEIVGTFNNKNQKICIEIIPNVEGISIVQSCLYNNYQISSTDQTLFELSFSDENIKLQWDEQIEQLAYGNSVSLWIKNETYKIFGKPDNLQWLYDLCKGKFLYLSKARAKLRTFINQNDTGIIYRLDEQCNTFELCFEKIINQKQQKFKQDYDIPEEIKVLKLINQNKSPYLIRLETIQYNGNEFSYCYKTKRLNSLNSLIKESQKLKINQVLDIIRQLLQVTNYFEQIKLVHNQLDLENVQYSKIDNVIQITNFSNSLLEKSKTLLYKAQTSGHASPESYSQQQHLTTATNIYQVGILFYIMVFGCNPFGDNQEEILKNNQIGNFCIPKFNGLMMEQYKKIFEQIFEMISSMMSVLPNNRQNSSYYLSSKIFSPNFKQKLSKMELSLSFYQLKEDDTINEENKFLNPIYTFKTKFQ